MNNNVNTGIIDKREPLHDVIFYLLVSHNSNISPGDQNYILKVFLIPKIRDKVCVDDYKKV